MGDLVALATFFSAVGTAIWWAWHEGLHQGSEADDAVVGISLRAAADHHEVEARVVNPSSQAVVALAVCRWVGRFRPVAGIGRTTRRTVPLRGHHGDHSMSDGVIVPIAPDRAETLCCAPSPSRMDGRLLVDIYVWQQCGRLRRHRRVVNLLPAKVARVSAAMASAERR